MATHTDTGRTRAVLEEWFDAIGRGDLEKIISTLSPSVVFDLPKDYLQTYQTKITAVTPEEVKQAAGVLVTPDRSVLTIVGDWKAVMEQLTDYPNVSFVDATGATAEEPR